MASDLAALSDRELWKRCVESCRLAPRGLVRERPARGGGRQASASGAGYGCFAAVVLVPLAVVFVLGGAPKLAVVAAVVALTAIGGVVGALQGRANARRAIEAVDAMVPRLASRGLGADEIASAAESVSTSSIDELHARIDFERDPFRRALGAVLEGSSDSSASLTPLCTQPTTVVVSVSEGWVAVLGFSDAGLHEARLHERRFQWHDGRGARVVELSLDVPDAETLARCLSDLRAEPESPPYVVGARTCGAESAEQILVGIGVLEEHGAVAKRAIAMVDIAAAADDVPPARDVSPKGPYRQSVEPSGDVVPDRPEIEIEEDRVGRLTSTRRRKLARAPVDDEPASVLAHLVLAAAARALSPLTFRWGNRVVTGRRFRVDGVSVLAPLVRRAAPRPARQLVVLDAGPRRPDIAARWLHAARGEHASIAAFRLVARALASHGAPQSLVDRAEAAARDEASHARDALALAAAYGGAALAPADLSIEGVSDPTLDTLTLETFVDGCVDETIAARSARAATVRCEVAPVREALERVANDERRHAELAWDMLAWLLPRAAPQVHTELARARSEVPPQRAPRVLAREDNLAAHGWLSEAEEREVAALAWRQEIQLRLRALLAP